MGHYKRIRSNSAINDTSHGDITLEIPSASQEPTAQRPFVRHQRFQSADQISSTSSKSSRRKRNMSRYPRLYHFFSARSPVEESSLKRNNGMDLLRDSFSSGTPESPSSPALLNKSFSGMLDGNGDSGLTSPYVSETTPMLDGEGLLEESRTILQTNYSSVGSTGTVLTSIISLTNTIMGVGVLGVPYAMASCGYVLGVILLIASACATWFTMRLLVYAAAHSPGRESTFASVAVLSAPRLVLVADAAVILNSMGTMITYIIAVGKYVPEFFHGLNQLYGYELPDWAMSPAVWVSVCIVLLLPFSLSTYIDNLVYFSAIALLCSLYLCFLCSFYFLSLGPTEKPNPKDLQAFRLSWDIFDVLPILTFAFVCHPNVFTIYSELKDATPGRISAIMSRSVFLSCVMYAAVGVSGYLAFGDGVTQDLFGNYTNGLAVALGRLAIPLLMFFSFPLYVYPCRVSFESIGWSVYGYLKRRNGFFQLQSSNASAIQETFSAAKLVSSAPKKDRQQFVNRCAATLVTLVVVWCVGLTATNVEDFVTVVGATGATMVSYVLPSIFYLALTKNRPGHKLYRRICYILIAVAFINGVGCALYAIA